MLGSAWMGPQSLAYSRYCTGNTYTSKRGVAAAAAAATAFEGAAPMCCQKRVATNKHVYAFSICIAITIHGPGCTYTSGISPQRACTFWLTFIWLKALSMHDWLKACMLYTAVVCCTETVLIAGHTPQRDTDLLLLRLLLLQQERCRCKHCRSRTPGKPLN